MLKAGGYDFLYRYWAPWDAVGIRGDLVDFVESGRVSPEAHHRSLDLGCGSGANVVYLASMGFDSYGVDFSKVALEKARQRASEAGVDARFVQGDLTAPVIEGLEAPFDFLVDFGTLDDLRNDGRLAMAETINRLSRPGTVFLEYCFFGERDDLPWLAMGPSKLSHIAPGELEGLFGDLWSVDQWRYYPDWKTAVFVLARER